MPTSNNSTEKKELTAEEMSFRNDAVAKIKSLQNENARLKDSIGRKRTESQKRRIGNAGSVAGLKTLGSKPSLP
jgi:cell shape-determining protein MreC